MVHWLKNTRTVDGQKDKTNFGLTKPLLGCQLKAAYVRIGLGLLILLLTTVPGLSQIRMVPHIAAQDGPFATRIQLVNRDSDPADYTLTAYDTLGNQTRVIRGTLAGGTTFAAESDALFEGAKVSHILIEGSEHVTVFAEYRERQSGSPAQVVATATQAKRWQFFPGDWQVVFDGYAVVNTGSQATDVVLRQFAEDGALLAEHVAFLGLAPNAKGIALVTEELFNLKAGHYFQIEGSQPLAFTGLRFNRPASNFLWQMPAIPLPESPEASTGKRDLTVFFTNDEHGWMESTPNHGGAAGLMAQWRDQEGYREDGPFLILSGGDMWTGPAISTWTQGESMTAVMNALQYDAAAIGNHEFDFGLETLKQRQSESTFPFLSANIREKISGVRPAFARPFTIVKVNEVNVGIIGLTTVSTPSITFPNVTGNFDFIGYEEALRETVPLVRAHGADMVVVTAHTCSQNLLPFAGTFSELDLSLVAGGHCNHKRVTVAEGVPIIEAGSFLRYYGKVRFEYDLDSQSPGQGQAELVENLSMKTDDTVQGVVDFWRSETDEELNEVIGYVQNPIPRRSPEMTNMITHSWLEAFPEAEISISNFGGIRQDIPAGDITRATIVGVLPFENLIYDLRLTGAQVRDNILCCGPVLGGMSRQNGGVLNDGTPLDLTRVYCVLTTDFLYEGGGGFLFRNQDPNPFNTGLNWRQPVIDWLRSLKTTPQNPLDQYLDATMRKR